MNTKCTLGICCLMLLLGACSAKTDAPGPEEIGSEAEALRVDAEAASTYYRLRHDLRRCAWPFCGGYWVEAVNRRATRCPDGSLADACYVAELDLGALASEERRITADLDRALFRGGFGESRAAGRTISTFDATEAWRAVTEAAPRGYFFKAVDTGIRCVRAPCDSQEAAFANYPWWFALDQLDLSGVGIGDDVRDSAYAALADDGLLVAGRHRLGFGPGLLRLKLEATQIYLPIQPEPSATCEPQRAEGQGLCEVFFGYKWNGTTCEGLSGCRCEGPDCDDLYRDVEACQLDHAECDRVFCGGLAGLPCPGRGTCVDDPADDCDPDRGGADCGGICECSPSAIRCPPGTHLDDSPEVCACVPDVEDLCERVRCPGDTFCAIRDGEAYCDRGSNPCAAVLCITGTVCRVVDGSPMCI